MTGKKLKEKAAGFLVILAYLIAGLIIMGIISLLSLPSWLSSPAILLPFIVLNVFTAIILRLTSELGSFWSLSKLYNLPVGFIAGAAIAVTPIIIALVTGQLSVKEITFGRYFTASSIVLTLIIVTWEELWFRGIFLNYCKRYLSEITISITIGVLFMLVHMLNPDIHLLKTGPTLFFAGLFLTLVYFYFKTIWLPVGLHFGNNYLALESKISKDLFFGNEGYIGAFILAGLSFLVIKLMRKQRMIEG